MAVDNKKTHIFPLVFSSNVFALPEALMLVTHSVSGIVVLFYIVLLLQESCCPAGGDAVMDDPDCLVALPQGTFFLSIHPSIHAATNPCTQSLD